MKKLAKFYGPLVELSRLQGCPVSRRKMVVKLHATPNATPHHG